MTAVAPYGPANASVRARLLQWLEVVPVANPTLVLGGSDPFGAAARLRALRLRRSSPAGPVLVLRNAAKLSRGGIEQQLLRSGLPGVYDLDDGLPWDDGRLPGLGAWWKRPWPRSLIAQRAASAADRVIAGNDLIAEWAAQWCRDVVVVPTCVDPNLYTTKSDWELGSVPRLGWMGSPATERYLVGIAPALAEVHRLTGARLTMVSGPGQTHPALSSFTDRVLWTLEREHTLPATWDVGLMPLHDGVYERAKCAFKLLVYGAAALPMVGSPVGASTAVLERAGSSAPSTQQDWVDSLVELLSASPSMRSGQGRSAADVVEQGYSFTAWKNVWSSAVALA